MNLIRCKLSKKKQLRLLELFVLEVTARSAADFLGIHPNSAALFYRKLRQRIEEQLSDVALEHGIFEADESYFGGVRKGKRGRGAAGKVPVFGILKRGGKVYTQMITDTRSATLLEALQKRIFPDSIVYTDSYRSYDVLDVSVFHHHRINHSERLVDQLNHINGMVFQRKHSIGFLKSVSFVLTMGLLNNRSKFYENGLTFNLI